MSEHEDGGAAFPVTNLRIGDQCYASPGMSLRDFFAAHALQAVILTAATNSGAAGAINEAADQSGRSVHEQVASVAYQQADAMLAERDKGDGD